MNRVLLWSLGLTLLLLPLPFGSVEEWSIFIFEAITFILFGAYLIDRLRQKQTSDADRDIPWGLKILIAVFFVFTAIQLIPLPPSLLRLFSPRSFEIAGLQNPIGWHPLTFSAAVSSYEFIKYVCYFLFAYLVSQSLRSRRDVEIFIWILLVAALFQSIYGLTEYWGGTGRIFGWENIYNQGSAFGTYINRDHFSGFLEMLFPISIGYILAKANFFSMRPGLSLKEKILWFSQERLQKTLIIGLASVILGLGIIFSRCRTGVFIFIASLFLMSIISPMRGGNKTETGMSKGKTGEHRRSSKIVRTVTVTVVFLAVVVGLNPVINRFTKEGWAWDLGRGAFYNNTLDLINMFLLTGTGPGTFIHAYPMTEKVANSNIIVDHAHNDYLEVLAESGIIGGGALILAAFGGVIWIFKRWLRRRDPFIRGVVLGALTGIMAMLVHSLMDFNLRIPANAVYFFALYVLAFRAVQMRREST